jgi:hypothetical protein
MPSRRATSKRLEWWKSGIVGKSLRNQHAEMMEEYYWNVGIMEGWKTGEKC